MVNTRRHSLWQQIQEAMLVDMAISKIMPHEVDTHHTHQITICQCVQEEKVYEYVHMVSGIHYTA